MYDENVSDSATITVIATGLEENENQESARRPGFLGTMGNSANTGNTGTISGLGRGTIGLHAVGGTGTSSYNQTSGGRTGQITPFSGFGGGSQNTAGTGGGYTRGTQTTPGQNTGNFASKQSSANPGGSHTAESDTGGIKIPEFLKKGRK